ncbi:MAG: hypothetical protein JST11_02680 [Acidobacteria bacterium]|nr:hypothetical protein [Acidobacteriota bacterium]
MTIAVRALRIAGGFGLLLVGGLLALPGVPGPGIPIMLLGLVLLSSHFAWAKRAMDWLKARGAALRARVQSGPSNGSGRA